MTHDEAKKSMAAEAYVLDDLEAAERNAFEEHFFDCTDCTADVLDAAKIADGVRTGNVVRFRDYSRWAAAAAAAAVVIGLSSQYAPQIAGLWKHSPAPIGQAAHAIPVPELPIELETTRGAAAVYHVRTNQPVGIYFTIPPSDVPPSTYTCVLLDASGHVVKSLEVRRDQAAEPVKISLSAGTLRNGDYKLVIRGGDREIPFTVEVP